MMVPYFCAQAWPIAGTLSNGERELLQSPGQKIRDYFAPQIIVEKPLGSGKPSGRPSSGLIPDS